MSSNPRFVFPPPPPPPPRASAPESTYQGQAHGHSLRGGFGGRGRGWNRGRGDGDRRPHESHYPRSSWDHNAARAQNAPQASDTLAQSAYGQYQTASYPSSGLTAGNNPPQPPPQHQAGAAQAQLSYGYMPQQAVQAQPAFSPPYSASYQPQASIPGSAFPLSNNGQFNLPPGHGVPVPMPQYGMWQPSAAPNQAQLMGPPIRMGFNNNAPSITPALPSNNHPVNYNLSAFTAPPQSHNISSANTHSPFNGYPSHPNQSPNPYPPNNHVSRDNGARGNESRRGQHHRSDQSFRKPRNEAPRPRAAPAVPSFLSASLPPKPDPSVTGPDVATGQERKKKKRKYNALGLTPRMVEHEESEDDVDEEIRLGNSIGLGGAQLKFEYNGQASVLETPADVAAWIEERKKRFPTKERIKEKEAERERRWKEAKIKKQESLKQNEQSQGKKKSKRSKKRQRDANKPKEQSEHVSDGDKKAERARKKREKIMKKLKEQQEKLQKLDAEMAGSGEAMASDAGIIGSKRKREDEGGDDSKAQPDDKETGGIKDENIGDADAQRTDTQDVHTIQGSAGEKTEDVPMKDEVEDELQTKTDQTIDPVPKPNSDPGHMKPNGSGLPIHQTAGINHTADIKHEKNISSDSSSLDSSDSDSDSDSSSSSSSSGKPDQQSNRRQGSSPGLSSNVKPHPGAPICIQFLRTGRCIRENKRGGCPYRHELPPRNKQPPKQKIWQKGRGMKKERYRSRKMGLYQRMLENDKEKEDLVLLHAVKYLGDKGFLST